MELNWFVVVVVWRSKHREGSPRESRREGYSYVRMEITLVSICSKIPEGNKESHAHVYLGPLFHKRDYEPTHTYWCGLPTNDFYQQGPLLGVF